MILRVRLSEEANYYYHDCDLSRVIDIILDIFDVTTIPSCDRVASTSKRVSVENENYLDLYSRLGARSPKVSLSRLLEFGYDRCVLSMPQLAECNNDRTQTDADKIKQAIALLRQCRMVYLDEIIDELTDLLHKTDEP